MALFFVTVYLTMIVGVCKGLNIPSVKLLNGYEMPVIGLGTFLLSDKQVDTAVTSALNSGYNFIDAALFYNNEAAIGKSLKKWFANGGKREDLFISSKLPPSALRPTDVEGALNFTLNHLGVDYLDMYLIHTPYGTYRTDDYQMLVYDNGTYAVDNSTDFIAVWKELQKFVKNGKVKSLGVCNFNKSQILRLWDSTDFKPTNLQIEINPYLAQEELINLAHSLGMAVTAYSPLGTPSIDYLRKKRDLVKIKPVIHHEVVQAIAKNHNKTPAQILLRYNLQRNLIVIPKSSHPQRIKENLDVFNFNLTNDDMDELKKLDMHGKYRKYSGLAFKGLRYHREYPIADLLPEFY